MAARGGSRHPSGGTTVRFPETDGRSRPRPDGPFAKEHGGATSKSLGSRNGMGIRMSNRSRSFVVLAALLTWACAPSAPGRASAPDPSRQPSVITDVVYGHKDGLALTFDVHRPTRPNGAGVIAIVSGGWQSSVEMSRLIVDGYLSPLLNEKGFTVFARSEEHTSELQSQSNLVCRLLLEKKKEAP